MELHEPEPTTDSERIAELYKVAQYLLAEMKGVRADISQIPARCNTETTRITGLEQWRSAMDSNHGSEGAPVRLRKLEVWQGRIAGGLVVIGMLTTAVLGWLVKNVGSGP
ncbi:MAG: hypothetical protein ACYC4L_11365 [Chloroflexota bacterium]